jgi:hypothetical protein
VLIVIDRSWSSSTWRARRLIVIEFAEFGESSARQVVLARQCAGGVIERCLSARVVPIVIEADQADPVRRSAAARAGGRMLAPRARRGHRWSVIEPGRWWRSWSEVDLAGTVRR